MDTPSYPSAPPPCLFLYLGIPRLNDQLVNIGSSLDEGVFVDATYFENPAPVLAELERVKQKLAAVDTLARQYSAYQALFGITVYR